MKMLLAVFIAMLLMVTRSLKAEESLLGMPKPLDPNAPGAVMLHGGGRISEEQFERFVELAGGKKAYIVMVPSAGFRVGDYNTEREFQYAVTYRYASWPTLKTSGRIAQFQFLYTDDPDHADDPRFVKALEKATGVWFSGGDQRRLNYRFVQYPETTLFQKALRDVLARGGVVGGTSAGMAALPEIMTLYEERDFDGAPANAVAAHGFGLFDRAIVEQHFDARGGRLERFTGLLRDSRKLDQLTGRVRAGERMMGIAVPESTALIVKGNRFEVMGTEVVHVFMKSHGGRSLHWHELAPGDTAQLRRGLNDTELRREETTLER